MSIVEKENIRFGYFKGLDSLRFFAAFLVVIMHIRASQITAGLPVLPEWPIFLKGEAAVSFFFVLSGFLITYILLKELESTNTISIKRFYLKRIFRIWPLYFIIVIFGLVFYWYVIPKLGMNFEIQYNKYVAIFLYIFFGANLMSSLYHVGGILNVLWSIAVEEQFYLFWAPLMKKWKDNLLYIIVSVFLVSYIIHCLNHYNLFSLPKGWQSFVGKLGFHYMAIGALFAWSLFKSPFKFLNLWIFKSKLGQLIFLTTLIGYIFLYPRIHDLKLIEVLVSSLLFGWIIINISVNPKKLFGLNFKIFSYLGKISYGIYMYHSIVIYFVSYIVLKFASKSNVYVLHVSTIIMVLLLTILVSGISYKFIESKILTYGRNRIKNI